MSDEMREDALLKTCCVGGARSPEAVASMLTAAGFEAVEVSVKEASRSFIEDWVPGSKAEDYVAAAEITARKSTDPDAKPPARTSCCS